MNYFSKSISNEITYCNSRCININCHRCKQSGFFAKMLEANTTYVEVDFHKACDSYKSPLRAVSGIA